MEDLYLEGFAEGRRSMARSIALKLQGSLPDEELASLLGLDAEGLAALLAPVVSLPEEPEEETHADAASLSATRPLPGHRLVEPAFVRVVRAARNLTQNELARILGVHPRTVCEWETSVHPCRIRTETYGRLSDLAAAVTAPDGARLAPESGVPAAMHPAKSPELPLFPDTPPPRDIHYITDVAAEGAMVTDAPADGAEEAPADEFQVAPADPPTPEELSDVPF